MTEMTFTICENDAGDRIDKWLFEQDIGLTRSSIQRLIFIDDIVVNKAKVNKNYKLREGDVIDIGIPDPIELDARPQNIPVEIVYEDDSLLVVNKPKGMVVHPAPGNPDGTLVNALMFHCQGRLSSINGVVRSGIVHRIDKYTSGLLIVAKTDSAHNHIALQIKEHSFTREYQALVCGKMSQTSGTIIAPIGRNKIDRKKMCVTQINSKDACTHYELICQYDNYAHLKFKLETGRTHQIRVHAAYIGHPVLGDDVYGTAFPGIRGQCLHAKKIGFIHPETEEYMEFDSDLPQYFLQALKKIQ